MYDKETESHRHWRSVCNMMRGHFNYSTSTTLTLPPTDAIHLSLSRLTLCPTTSTQAAQEYNESQHRAAHDLPDQSPTRSRVPNIHQWDTRADRSVYTDQERVVETRRERRIL